MPTFGVLPPAQDDRIEDGVHLLDVELALLAVDGVAANRLAEGLRRVERLVPATATAGPDSRFHLISNTM